MKTTRSAYRLQPGLRPACAAADAVRDAARRNDIKDLPKGRESAPRAGAALHVRWQLAQPLAAPLSFQKAPAKIVLPTARTNHTCNLACAGSHDAAALCFPDGPHHDYPDAGVIRAAPRGG
jgi:hypothetical protein